MHVYLPLTRRFMAIQSGNTRRSAQSRTLLTPREVERRHPALSRRFLAKRRARGLPPKAQVVSGCFMYEAAEIERCVGLKRNEIASSKERKGPAADDAGNN
jgi:hypothetical protein